MAPEEVEEPAHHQDEKQHNAETAENGTPAADAAAAGDTSAEADGPWELHIQVPGLKDKLTIVVRILWIY